MAKVERAYLRNSLLIECSPIVHFLFEEFKSEKCDYCMTSNKLLKKCSNCKKMYYCDQKCQKNDWICHKLECTHYKNNYDILSQNRIQRILLRLYLVIESDPQIVNKTYETFNGQKRCLNDLMTHFAEIQEDSERQTEVLSMQTDFKSIGIEIPIEVLTKLFGILVINSFGIVIRDIFKGYEHCGSGLYVSASVLDHSCAPNVYAIANQNSLQLKAAKDISINEELFVSYIDTQMTTTERRKELKERYYFDCNCTRCEFSDNNKLMDDFNEKLNLNNESSLRLSYNPNLTFGLLEDLKRRLSGDNKDNLSDQLNQYIDYVRNHITVAHGQHHYLYDLFISIVKSNGFLSKK